MALLGLPHHLESGDSPDECVGVVAFRRNADDRGLGGPATLDSHIAVPQDLHDSSPEPTSAPQPRHNGMAFS